MYTMCTSRYVVYIILCEENKYYVGRCESMRLNARFAEHSDGRGCAWTSRYKAIRLEHVSVSTDPLDEDRKVLEVMRVFGINNVRGGSYSSCVLDRISLESLRRQLRHAAGLCINCGSQNHWAAGCSRHQIHHHTHHQCEHPPLCLFLYDQL